MNTSHLKYSLLKEMSKMPNFWQKMTENVSAKKFGNCVWHFTNEHFARMTENFCFRSSSIFFDLTPNKKVDHFSERQFFLRERRTLVSWVRFKRFFAPKNVAFWNFAKWKSTRSKLKLYLFFTSRSPPGLAYFLTIQFLSLSTDTQRKWTEGLIEKAQRHLESNLDLSVLNWLSQHLTTYVAHLGIEISCFVTKQQSIVLI